MLLEVELVGKGAARLEARLRVALQPLDDALRLRITRLEDAPADAEHTAEGRERHGRAAAARVQSALAVPDQRLRQTAELDQTVADPVQQVGRLLREDERAGAGARVGQAADHDVAAPRLAGADRDLPARLPEIELTERARPIGGALKVRGRGRNNGRTSRR